MMKHKIPIKSLFILSFCLFFTGCYNTLPENIFGHHHSDKVICAPNGKGKLAIVNDVKILKLKGTNQEMGYAHGYLMADEIMIFFNDFLTEVFQMFGAQYGDLQAAIYAMDWDPAYMSELEGMLEGINAKLCPEDRIISFTGEEVTIEDLMTLNIVSELGCSSIAAWGDNRYDNSLIVAHNFDYPPGLDSAAVKCQVIISYDDGIHNTWVTTSFGGLIGCISGMNENGMILSIHDTECLFFGTVTTDPYGFSPRLINARHIMESAGPDATPASIEAAVDTTKLYMRANMLVAFPPMGRQDDEIAGVIEYDGNALHPDGRATLRLPSGNPNLFEFPDYDERLFTTDAIVCTNHFLQRKGEDRSGADELSRARIPILSQGVLEAGSDGNISKNESLAMMQSVSDLDYLFTTLNTVIFEPKHKNISFYIAQPGVPAASTDPVVVKYPMLFN